MSKHDISSPVTRPSELQQPDVRPVPALNTGTYSTGVSDHAAKRYQERATAGIQHAVRRAYAAGGELSLVEMGEEKADSMRYDPLTGTILVERNGCVVTVYDADSPTLWAKYAAELERRGWL